MTDQGIEGRACVRFYSFCDKGDLNSYKPYCKRPVEPEKISLLVSYYDFMKHLTVNIFSKTLLKEIINSSVWMYVNKFEKCKKSM